MAAFPEWCVFWATIGSWVADYREWRIGVVCCIGIDTADQCGTSMSADAPEPPILDEKCRIRWWKFDTSLYADRRGIASGITSGITIGSAEIGFDVGSCVTTGSGKMCRLRSKASST